MERVCAWAHITKISRQDFLLLLPAELSGKREADGTRD